MPSSIRGWEWNSVDVDPDFDAVGVVQADEHGPPSWPVTIPPWVRRGRPGAPASLDIGPGGHREGDRVETGQRGASSSTDSGVAGGSSGVPGPGDPDPPQGGLVDQRDEPVGENAGMKQDQRRAVAAGVCAAHG